MSAETDGGPAFPRAEFGNDGMSLRDYFAAAALQGVVAAGVQGTVNDYADWAYRCADAMVSQRDVAELERIAKGK